MSFMKTTADVGYVAQQSFVSEFEKSIAACNTENNLAASHNAQQKEEIKTKVNKNVLTMGKVTKNNQISKMLKGILNPKTNAFNGLPKASKSKGPNVKMCRTKEGPIPLAQCVKKNEIGVTKSNPSNTVSFLEVFQREQIDPPNKVGVVAQSSNKANVGRGPAVHEALQRLPRKKNLNKKKASSIKKVLSSEEWHAPQSPADELSDSSSQWSDTDETPLPCYSSYVWSDLTDVNEGGERLRRLAAKRGGMRRRLAYVTSATPNDKYHKLAQLIQKDVNSKDVGSPIEPDLLETILKLRGVTSLLSSQDKRVLRQSGWSGASWNNESDFAHNSNHNQKATELLNRVLTTQPCDVRQPIIMNNPDLVHRPKKPLPRKRNSSTRRPNHSKRKKTLSNAIHTGNPNHEVSSQSLCDNVSPAYDSNDDILYGGGRAHEEDDIQMNDQEGDHLEHTPVVCRDNTEIVLSSCAEGLNRSNGSSTNAVDNIILNNIPDDAFNDFFNPETVVELGEGEELARVLESVLDDNTFTDVFSHRNRMALQTAATVEVYSSEPS